MNLVNWNDNRLDGFAANFDVLDKKVDHMIIDQTNMRHDIDDLKLAKSNATSNNQWRWMFVATLLSSPLTAAAVVLLTRGK